MKFNMFEDAEMGGVHHGSGFDFDVFDPDKIGSAHGIGYGWGFYLTTILDTAESYAYKSATAQNHKLSDKLMIFIRSYFYENDTPIHLRSAFFHSVHVLGSESYLLGSKLILSQNSYGAIKNNIKKYINDRAAHYKRKDFVLLVDILDKLYPNIEAYLKQWKDPIRYGIRLVKDGGDFNFIDFDGLLPKDDLEKVINQLREEGLGEEGVDHALREMGDDYLDGELLYRFLFVEVFDGKSKKDVSMFLLRAGFDGIFIPKKKFYVVFDPKIIRIVEKTKV